ncbi:MAG: hypothetical protein IPF95_01680 [Flavobacteriales bacterium]|nr:hypothetical protein [Flavobacteriales bacterium]
MYTNTRAGSIQLAQNESWTSIASTSNDPECSRAIIRVIGNTARYWSTGSIAITIGIRIEVL